MVALASTISLSNIFLATQTRFTLWVYVSAAVATGAVAFLALLALQFRALLAKLKEHHDIAVNLLDSIPTMVFAKDATDLQFVQLNHAGKRLLGYPRESLLRQSDRDIFPPDQAEFFIS